MTTTAVLVSAMLAAMLVAAMPARAENLIAALSADEVNISSNFTGTEIVVFGEIGRDAATVARADPYDLAVVVSGPLQRVTTRRKERFFGLWINREAETFAEVPGFYAVHSTRPTNDLGHRTLLERLGIGLYNINLPVADAATVPPSERPGFRQAFLRLRTESGLYAERHRSIEFLSDSLFRTNIPLTANVPVGTYEVTTYLLRGGALLAQDRQTLTIAKTGFEQFTYMLASRYAAVYGATAVILALVTGWLASVIFRRD